MRFDYIRSDGKTISFDTQTGRRLNMDPQVCLNEMFAAVQAGDIEAAQERLFDLATWIEKGGHYPELTPPIRDIIEARRAMQRHHDKIASHIDGEDRDDLGESPDF
jgi:hypothetical protein